jgi:25S rRNA (uracil2634-N3)-methyltransferase
MKNNFIKDPWLNMGRTLLVGERNFSFAKSLLQRSLTTVTDLTATTFEKENEITDEVLQNIEYLQDQSNQIKFAVDAKKLDQIFSKGRFDTIIFQFPNVGSREPIKGHNPNHILLVNFLKSALDILSPTGHVLLTTVNSPYYDGVFQYEDAALKAGYSIQGTYPFYFSWFPNYIHTNTLNEDSAADEYDKFITRIFVPNDRNTV